MDRFDENSENCAKDGEYVSRCHQIIKNSSSSLQCRRFQCQTHHECCSKSCLSFSYKCVPSHQRPSANAPGASFTNTTSQIGLDDLINRFGGGEFEDTAVASGVASTPAPAATPSVTTTTRQNCRGLGSQVGQPLVTHTKRIALLSSFIT